MSPTTTKFSVIIPTRERADVLESALRTVTQQDYDALDIVVSDNFSSDNTEEVVRGNGDPRVRYFNTGRRLSMSHNYEFALSKIDSGWVTIVGDDDGLVPGALRRVAEIAAESGVLSVRSATGKYRWPGFQSQTYGQLKLPMGHGYEVRDCAQWLAMGVEGSADYTELPMLYTGGFTDMSVISGIKARTGDFYRSCVPDVYSALAIASVLPRYAYSFAPLAINGTSKHSVGTTHFSGHSGDGPSPVDKFLTEDNIPMHKDIPVCDRGLTPRSSQTVFLESYLQTTDLRSEAPDRSFFAAQLEIVLSTSEHDPGVIEWAQKFAVMHELDYKAALGIALRRKALRRLTGLPKRFLRRRKIYSAGSASTPIKNVQEASRLAGDACAIYTTR